MKAVILAGGKGTRLQSVVSDLPKPMAPVGGRPFLEYLIEQLSIWRITDIILSVGYKKDSVISYFDGGNKWGVRITYLCEESPLGTGGAVVSAAAVNDDKTFLVLNGDSYCPIDMNAFADFHHSKHATISMALVRSNAREDYGRIDLDHSGRIISFQEKSAAAGTGFINAGIYLFDKDAFAGLIPGKPYSLEYDVFPSFVGKSFFGFAAEKDLIDIGTPARYEYANRFFSNRNRKA